MHAVLRQGAMKPERLDAEARRRLKSTYKRKDTPARRKRYRPKKRKGKS